METPSFCPKCRTALQPADSFCPQCGEKLNEPSLTLSFGRTIVIYLISFFVPPSGLYYGYIYLKQDDGKVKTVGKIAIIITSISLLLTIVTIFLAVKLANEIMQSTQTIAPSDLKNLGL